MASKQMAKTKQEVIDEIEHVIKNAHKTERYLFLGKSYDTVLDEALIRIPAPKCYLIETYSINDRDFLNDLISNCAGYSEIEGHLAILRLKNKCGVYQKRLLVPLERLSIPLLVFADNEGLSEPFMSRFGHIRKQSNENLKTTAFMPLNRILSKPYISSPYDCPSLIKLGDFNNLSPSNKKMDILISKLSGGNVYSEVLSELQAPIKDFDANVKLEALSLLKKRFD